MLITGRSSANADYHSFSRTCQTGVRVFSRTCCGRPDPHRPPVRPALDGPVEVRPEDLGPGVARPGQDLPAGEAVGVALADGHEHEPGTDGVQEIPGRRGGAAVVPGLEDRRGEPVA